MKFHWTDIIIGSVITNSLDWYLVFKTSYLLVLMVVKRVIEYHATVLVKLLVELFFIESVSIIIVRFKAFREQKLLELWTKLLRLFKLDLQLKFHYFLLRDLVFFQNFLCVSDRCFFWLLGFFFFDYGTCFFDCIYYLNGLLCCTACA